MKTTTDMPIDPRQLEFRLVSPPKPKQMEMFKPPVLPESNERWYFAPRAKGRGKVQLPPKRYVNER